MRGKEVVKLLEHNSWRVQRTKGSHYIMEKDGNTIAVPVHNKDLGKGILNKLLKQVGIDSRGNTL
jgi:predicted RNA binding protein YcfA (HicA-like mRNA interferase family)